MVWICKEKQHGRTHGQIVDGDSALLDLLTTPITFSWKVAVKNYIFDSNFAISHRRDVGLAQLDAELKFTNLYYI